MNVSCVSPLYNWKICNECIPCFTTVLNKYDRISDIIPNHTHEKKGAFKPHTIQKWQIYGGMGKEQVGENEIEERGIPSVASHDTPASLFGHFHSFDAFSNWTDLTHLRNKNKKSWCSVCHWPMRLHLKVNSCLTTYSIYKKQPHNWIPNGN